MKKLWKLAVISFRQQMSYRTALVAGFATNLFFGFFKVAVILALYGDKDIVNGMSIDQAVAYVIITQSLIAFLSLFSYFEIMKTIYTGDIASDLLRPVDFFLYWLAKDAGRSMMNLLGRGILLVAVFMLFYSMPMPSAPSTWLIGILSLILSWVLTFTWRFLVNIVAFWTTDGVGIWRLSNAVMLLVSGFILPLRLLPDWFTRVANFTPFPSMVNTFTEILLGSLSGADIWPAIGIQALWCVGLIIVTQLVLMAGLQKLTVQGG